MMSNIIMQLRKAANHPLLMRELYGEDAVATIAERLVANAPSDPDDQRFVGATREELCALLGEWSDFQLHALCCEKAALLGDLALPEAAFFEAGKVQRFCEVVGACAAQSPPSKVLVFSQMTRMLDILEHVARCRRWPFLRMDGSTPVAERQCLVDAFNADPVCKPIHHTSTRHNTRAREHEHEQEVLLFLLSTKAAGNGLNLTGASTVVFYDVSFNPQDDKQAEDRCHRIGQHHAVTVYRLLNDGTIDDCLSTSFASSSSSSCLTFVSALGQTWSSWARRRSG